MKIKVILHSALRLLLPENAHGKADLEINDGSRLKSLLEYLKIEGDVAISVNNHIETNMQLELRDGDEVQIFRPSGGGNF